MKIGVVGSMQFTNQTYDTVERLKSIGHNAYLTDLHKNILGKSKQEGILVLNLKKNGIENYIGANTFLEMGFPHVLNQKIYVFNPLPKNDYLMTELKAMRPLVINQNLSKIPLKI